MSKNTQIMFKYKTLRFTLDRKAYTLKTRSQKSVLNFFNIIILLNYKIFTQTHTGLSFPHNKSSKNKQ